MPDFIERQECPECEADRRLGFCGCHWNGAPIAAVTVRYVREDIAKGRTYQAVENVMQLDPLRHCHEDRSKLKQHIRELEQEHQSALVAEDKNEYGWKPSDRPTPMLVRAADRLYLLCEQAIHKGLIGARSAIGDATLDYRDERNRCEREPNAAEAL